MGSAAGATTCPNCQRAMEAGFVMGMEAASSFQSRPATIGWIAGAGDPTRSGWSEQLNAEPLSDLPFGVVWGERPRFPGWRCESCHLVLFRYEPTRSAP